MDRPVRFASLCIASIGLSWLLGCGGSAPPNPTLTISTSSLPDGTIGTAYSQTVSASGGSGSFTWNIASGALPDNLTLASSGNSAVISGTPDQVQSRVAFTIHVIDSKGASTSDSYTVSIQGAPGVGRHNLVRFREPQRRTVCMLFAEYHMLHLLSEVCVGKIRSPLQAGRVFVTRQASGMFVRKSNFLISTGLLEMKTVWC